MNTRNRGFTLIELLVVIAIIGILSAVVLTSLNSARVKARDAQRKSEMHEVRNALELYATDKGAYPLTSGGSTDTWLADIVGLAPRYIASIPRDPLAAAPKGTDDYHYWTGSPTIGYSLLMYDEQAGTPCVYVVGGIEPSSWITSGYPSCESL